MKYHEGEIGRIFVLRLEPGDRLPDTIENFAAEKEIDAGSVYFLGGADDTSRIVVGPRDGKEKVPVPQVISLPAVSETIGFGMLFKNADGVQKLHMHASFGHGNQAITGCAREGVDVWLCGEVLIMEIVGSKGIRKVDPNSGFELLEFTE